MLKKFRLWRDRRRLARNTHPTGVRQAVIPSAREARHYRHRIEHEMVLDLLEELHDSLAWAATSTSLDVSELSEEFTDALETTLSNLGYEIQRGHNGDRDVIRLIVSW